MYGAIVSMSFFGTTPFLIIAASTVEAHPSASASAIATANGSDDVRCNDMRTRLAGNGPHRNTASLHFCIRAGIVARIREPYGMETADISLTGSTVHCTGRWTAQML